MAGVQLVQARDAQTSTRPAVHAAGAIVWRLAGAQLEVLLVHRPRYDDWSWPKGKLEPGESLPACAVRETAEETGVAVELGQPLPEVRYKLSDGRLKVCHYWAARVVDPNDPAVVARGGGPLCSEDEVDSIAWLPATKARKALSRASDRAPLDALVDLWDEGTLDTRALLVLRHARAKKRSAWPGGELDRPLTALGLHHAADIVPTLAAFGVERVLSSPWERCVATVAPYARAAEVDVVAVPEITEHAAKRNPAAARRALARVLSSFRGSSRAKANPGTVICTHRPVLPTMMAVLSERSPHRVADLLPAVNPYLRPGEVLVAHVLGRHRRGVRIVAVEQHRPPR